MPPFWKTLLGGSSGSSSSSTSTALSSSNSNSSISNAQSNTGSSSLSPRKAAAASSSSFPSSSSPASNGASRGGSGGLHSHKTTTAATTERSSPIVIPSGHHSNNSNNGRAGPAGVPVGNAAADAGISPHHQQAGQSHQHSTSIASSRSGISSSTSYADDTDDAPIPETPYSTGHSPSHARHKFPHDGSKHSQHHHNTASSSNNQHPSGVSPVSGAPSGRTDSSGSGDDGEAYLSEEDDDEEDASDSNKKKRRSASSSGMSMSFTSVSSSSSASGAVPNARQSPLKPDIPTTHTILANPLPQPSSGLAAAISSVLPSSASSSNSNAATMSSSASSNGKAGIGPGGPASGSATSAAGGGSASEPTGPRTFDIDDMISRLLETGYSGKISKSVSLKNSEITALCLAAREVFLSQPTLLELSPPVNIVGDVHGQYSDLIRLFEMCTFPPHANYLFLGDYVDRGKQSLETILLLLCYKVKYPENFFLLRGNHECANVTRVYGFYDECKRRCNLKIWKTFVDVFNCLPIAALVAGKIFCVHGGLSPSLSSMDDIRRISRPTDVPDYGLLNDLLWSDPSDTALDWEDNERGVSYCFGKAVIQEFLAKYDFDLICRAHMVVEDGYEFWNDRTLVTIFSAPNYCGEFDNFASSMLVNEDLLCSFELLKPLDGAALKKELAKCRKKNSAGLLPPRPAA